MKRDISDQTHEQADVQDSNQENEQHPVKKLKPDDQSNQNIVKVISSIPVKLGLISEQDNLLLESLYLSSQKNNLDLRKANGGGRGKGFDGARKWETRSENSSARDLVLQVKEKLMGGAFKDEKKGSKKKVVLFMSYNGTGYHGMQMNPGVPSIELDLHKAFALSGAVSIDNAMDLAKTQFVRCARTDKGVHAGGSVISMKMNVEDSDIIQKINSYLAPQIRVWGYVRAINNFHAKNKCDSRVYEYHLPTYVLQSASPALYPLSRVGIESAADTTLSEEDKKNLFSVESYLEKISSQDLAERRGYRISSDALEQFRSIVKEYLGAHCFWNFTIGKSYKDKSTSRFMKTIKVSDPIVHDDMEWIRITIHGQSFMLHQIRKMMGLAILMMRTKTPVSMVNEMFGTTRFNVPKAPALGLLLVEPKFDEYNAHGRQKSQHDPPPEISFEPFASQVQTFKEEQIYSQIYADEKAEAVFDAWVRSVDSNPDDYAWFLTPDGKPDVERKPERMLVPGDKGVDAEAGEDVVDGDDE